MLYKINDRYNKRFKNKKKIDQFILARTVQGALSIPFICQGTTITHFKPSFKFHFSVYFRPLQSQMHWRIIIKIVRELNISHLLHTTILD